LRAAIKREAELVLVGSERHREDGWTCGGERRIVARRC